MSTSFQQGVTKYYDDFASQWDSRFRDSRAFRYFLTKRLAMLREHLGTGYSSVIDAGCGTGYYILGLLKPGVRGVGFDIAPKMIAEATKKKEADFADLDCTFRVEDGHALTFADGSFERAICVGYLIHLENPEKALAELHRVLAPGGRIVALISNRWSPWLVLGLRRRFAKDYGVLPGDKEMSPREARAMFERVGFTNVRIEMFNTLPGKLPNWAYYPARLLNLVFSVWPFSLLGFHILVVGEKR